MAQPYHGKNLFLNNILSVINTINCRLGVNEPCTIDFQVCELTVMSCEIFVIVVEHLCVISLWLELVSDDLVMEGKILLIIITLVVEESISLVKTHYYNELMVSV